MIRQMSVIAGVVLVTASCGHQKTSTRAKPASSSETVAANTAAAQAKQAKRLAMARAAVAEIKQKIKSMLMARLVSEGPEDALDACRLQARWLGKKFAQAGIVVGRTSHRLRNPKNAPKPWIKPVLAHYRQVPRAPEGDYHAVELPDGKLAYAEPIYLGTVCVKCHGLSISASVSSKLRALYPQDQARGFAAGRFRGLFWAEVKATN